MATSPSGVALAATTASSNGASFASLPPSSSSSFSPTRDDIDAAVLLHEDNDDAVFVPLTPSPTSSRGQPSIAPPMDSDSVFPARQVVPGIGIKMSAKEAKRLRRSEIEKRSRQRRQGSVSSMRAELNRLERQYALLMSMDENATEGAILNPSEVSDLRARYVQLSTEAAALRDEEKSLREILHEKQLFSDAISALLTQFAGDDPFMRHSVFHSKYEPMEPAKCFEYMRDAYETISRFDNDRNLVSSGSSVMGWTDKRRLDETTGMMHFAFTKRFGAQHTPERLMLESWDMFRDEGAMRRTIFSAGVQVNLQTLQVVSDDILIMHRHTRYVAMQRSFHTVYLLFRMQTERGYMVCFRTIPCPSIQNAMEEGESWIELFHWNNFNRVDLTPVDLHDDHEGVEILFGGSLGGSVLKFAMHWMIELIMTVIRWENACVAPLYLIAPTL